jgi:anti-sigma B factor antagonist
VEQSGGFLNLRFASEVLRGIHVLSVSGEVDYSVKDQFDSALTSAVDGVHSPLVIDLTRIRYMDSTGLNALARAKSRMMARNDELYIVLSQPHLIKVFAMVGFDKLLRIHETLDDAVAAAQGN